jgi:hypothetical protein
MFKKNIENLEFTITQKMYDQHDKEWETIKSGYSSRANLDSEYLEDYIIETVEDAYRIEGKDRYYADIEYKEFKIDFKEIASHWYNLQHDYTRYLDALQKNRLTHFLFFRTNRPRYNSPEYKNMPDVIPVDFNLKFEYLGCYDVMHVMECLEPPRLNRVRIETLQNKHGDNIKWN